MPNDSFEVNLLRVISAELYFLAGMTASREMFGKSYFSLGGPEKVAVDQMVQSFVAANFQSATAESLKNQAMQPKVGV